MAITIDQAANEIAYILTGNEKYISGPQPDKMVNLPRRVHTNPIPVIVLPPPETIFHVRGECWSAQCRLMRERFPKAGMREFFGTGDSEAFLRSLSSWRRKCPNCGHAISRDDFAVC